MDLEAVVDPDEAVVEPIAELIIAWTQLEAAADLDAICNLLNLEVAAGPGGNRSRANRSTTEPKTPNLDGALSPRN